MKVLCPITPWKTAKITVGKKLGEEIITRLVVAADNWCWNISLENRDAKTLTGQSFYKGMCHLIPSAIFDYGCSVDIIDEIAKSLKVETTIFNPKGKMDRKTLEKLGKDIDSLAKTNYNLVAHEGVYKRIFGETAVEQKEE